MFFIFAACWHIVDEHDDPEWQKKIMNHSLFPLVTKSVLKRINFSKEISVSNFLSSSTTLKKIIFNFKKTIKNEKYIFITFGSKHKYTGENQNQHS